MEPVDGRPVGWDGHLVLVHHNEQQRRAGVAAWARRGLDLGAKILYLEPAEEPSERSFRSVLDEHGVDSDGAWDRGQVQVLPANDETYSPIWQAGVVDEALADGFGTVRWSGEATTAWRVMRPSVHARIEWAADELCRSRPVSSLCQYSAGLTQPTLQTVCAMHAGGLRQSLLQTYPIPEGIAVAGEVDRSNERLLRSALTAAAATRSSGEPLVVDLAGLGFLDVAGARALLTGTTNHRIDGGCVRLRAAQRPVDRVLRLLGVDRETGFRMEALS